MADTVILASGGINSTVAAAHARRAGTIHLLFADYAQRASRTRHAALRQLADAWDVPLTVISLPHVAAIASLTKEGAVRENAEDEVRLERVARVPGLMSTLIGAGLQLAHRLGAKSLAVGSSEAADEIETESAPGQGTPDHRRDYFYLAGLMVEHLQKSKTPLRLETPLIDLARTEIIRLGTRYEVPFDLTYSCDTGNQSPCNECTGCHARRKAFDAAKLLDPAISAVS